VPDLKTPPDWLVPKVSGVFSSVDLAVRWVVGGLGLGDNCGKERQKRASEAFPRLFSTH
jgi:hypothetical protein